MEDNNKQKIYKLTWYFIIFSIFGMIVETLYCYITTGVIESRKGLIWGPFSPVYGVGAVVLIIGLNKFRKKWVTLFISGFILGSILEYVLSFILEAVYGVRFWEYSYIAENINGRICFTYSIFWGILSVILMKIAKPLIDKLINLISYKIGKNIQIFITVFLIIDCFATMWALDKCKIQAVNVYNNIEIKEEENYFKKTKTNLEEYLFPAERVLKAFPNIRIRQNNKQIFIRDIL